MCPARGSFAFRLSTVHDSATVICMDTTHTATATPTEALQAGVANAHPFVLMAALRVSRGATPEAAAKACCVDASVLTPEFVAAATTFVNSFGAAA